jgi:hypothetical protein
MVGAFGGGKTYDARWSMRKLVSRAVPWKTLRKNVRIGDS